MKKLLCLDFDGVICNSQAECLVTSYVAYNRLMGKKIENIDSVIIPDIIKKNFYNYRYLVRPAWQYLILIKLLNETDTITEKVFTNYCKKMEKNREKLAKYFFKTRLEWISNNPKSWFELNPIYLDVKTNWNKILDSIETFIVTNKNFHSVKQLLIHHNLNFPEKNIFGKEKIKSKSLILRSLSKKLDIKRNQIIFVDDSSFYVSEMLNLGFESYLAGWGYEKGKINSSLIPKNNVLYNFGGIVELINNHEK